MEVTLYNRSGNPIAYIADDADNAIYMWNGHAVCYIFEDKIYGWRGKHIGWFINNRIYDLNGFLVGFTKNTCPVITTIPTIKNIKYIKSIKSVRNIATTKPILSTQYSEYNLKFFLEQNS